MLVSNAAVNPQAGPILEMDDQAVDKILDINGEPRLPAATRGLHLTAHDELPQRCRYGFEPDN